MVNERTAWLEPGPHEVAPGVHRIPLPLPIVGLTAVNCYALPGPDGLVLVDPGWRSDESVGVLTDALRVLGYGLGDVRMCVVTHNHLDHYSQAYAWRESLGVDVRIGVEERHSIRGYSPDAAMRFPVHAAQLVEDGAADLAARVAAGVPDPAELAIAHGEPDGWLADGDRVPLADGRLEVIATPGHTRGHVVFRHSTSGVLFTGDHVLPFITPSIGFEWTPEEAPLRSFLHSLDLMLAVPDGALLPAHGPVRGSTHARVKEQIAHHDERLAEVLELAQAGPVSAYSVAAAMPWTRRRRALADLEVEHQMIAVSEIRAHLEVLRLQGRLAAERHDGLVTYTVVAGA
ncbi:MBL fold metallo-hydrolase [Tsukamurella soli]